MLTANVKEWVDQKAGDNECCHLLKMFDKVKLVGHATRRDDVDDGAEFVLASAVLRPVARWVSAAGA